MNTEYYNDVRQFMSTFGQKMPRGFVDSDNETADARKRMLAEEYHEWQDAPSMSVALLDALVDLQYIVKGTLLAMGIPELEPRIPAGLTYSEGKMPIHGEVAMALSALARRPLCPAMLTRHLNFLADALLVAAAVNYIPFDSCWRKVHAANMNKQWTKEELDQCPEYRPYASRITAGRSITVMNEYGKIVKPPSFRPPDLRPELSAARRCFAPPAPAAERASASSESAPPVPDQTPAASSPRRRPVKFVATGKTQGPAKSPE